MKTTLCFSPSSEIETECLVAVVLDRGEKDKTEVFVSATDKSVRQAASDILSGGEVTGKSLETTLLHKPNGVKAKRLLLLGGGKSKKFSISDLRKLAGVAVRSLKSKGVRGLAF